MRCLIAASLLLLVPLLSAQADVPGCGAFLQTWWEGVCHHTWSCQQPCPDDYCGKPFPPFGPRANCGIDDYCNKPFPPFGPRAKCGVDDYCGKPFPVVEPLCKYPPWYHCTPCK
jgi:hypothetical protein